ncbi:MAG TPA: 50S ribosomal protein L3 [Gemmatimonadaceae bacterium]|nr:50S ribosomal protein L3 [Gemmatimonadaceae bacterium]
MIGIIGRKLGMTQIFTDDGEQVPCTVIAAEPNTVVQVPEPAAAGGHATVQLGFEMQRVRRAAGEADGGKKGAGRKARAKERTPRGRRASLAETGHAAKAGLDGPPAVLRSFRLDDAPGKNAEVPSYTVGDKITVEIFTPGDQVKVTGTSKGRGFQGVVKRHGFGGGPNTHGNTKHRRPGSIGPGTDPSRVIKGKRMPGHYGAERHTQINLRVVKVDSERNLLYVRGAVAGARNGIVLVRKQG